MDDYDKIWRRSESLIKGGQPVTYGNVSQWISGCPGFSFSASLLLMAECPRSVLLVSSQLTQTDTHMVAAHTHTQSDNVFILTFTT